MMPMNDNQLYVKTQLISDHQAMQDLKSGTSKDAPRVAHRMWYAIRPRSEDSDSSNMVGPFPNC